MIRRYLPKNVEELVHWYERYVSPLSLVAGFISDNLFLTRRVDLWTTNALLSFYLVVSAGGIVLLNRIESSRVLVRRLLSFAPIVPLVIQFAFGGLFSGFLSLYSRSAGDIISWIFVAIVAVLLIGNERFSRLYVRVPFQIAILFTTLFAFLIFFLPVVFHRIGEGMFIASGLSALAIASLFIILLMRLVPETRKHLTTTARAIAVIYIVFNILYFTNAIPPLPLALKDAGVYHNVVHDTVAGQYLLQGELFPWYERFLPIPSVFREAPGESAFVYTSIFAPSGLSTLVVDQWQWYDPAQKSWTTEASIAYQIQGGRDGGYEGYSEYPSPQEGKWRVNVLTGYGQLIGRVSFTVVAVPAQVPLESETK